LGSKQLGSGDESLGFVPTSVESLDTGLMESWKVVVKICQPKLDIKHFQFIYVCVGII
jgi:hypothetical protein